MSIGRLQFDRRKPDAGRNFIAPQARKRLFDEAAERFNEEQRNAISVHGTYVRYFNKLVTGKVCTCHLQDMNHPASHDAHVTIESEFREPVGNTLDAGVEDLFEDDTSILSEDASGGVGDDLWGNTNDCACCFRTGITGGYSEIHHSRQVFDSAMAVEIDGFHIDTSTRPYSLINDGAGGCVGFRVTVPASFEEVEFGVMNNRELLHEELFFMDTATQRYAPLTRAELERHAGDEMLVYVREAKRFSHVVLNFSLPSTPLVADFPQDQRNLDYSRFENAQPQTMVISDLLPSAALDDVAVKQATGNSLMMQCSDYQPYQLANGKNMGFTLTMRPVQPDELLRALMKFHRL